MGAPVITIDSRHTCIHLYCVICNVMLTIKGGWIVNFVCRDAILTIKGDFIVNYACRDSSRQHNGIYVALRLEALADCPNRKTPSLMAECVSGVHRNNVSWKRFYCVKQHSNLQINFILLQAQNSSQIHSLPVIRAKCPQQVKAKSKNIQKNQALLLSYMIKSISHPNHENILWPIQKTVEWRGSVEIIFKN